MSLQTAADSQAPTTELRPEDVTDAMLTPLSNAYHSTKTLTYGQQLVAAIHNAVVAERGEPVATLTDAERLSISKAANLLWNLGNRRSSIEFSELDYDGAAEASKALDELLRRDANKPKPKDASDE